MTTRTYFAFTLIVCHLSASIGTVIAAERPAAPYLLPEQTLAYLRITDTRDMLKRLNESSMGRMMKDEQVKPLANKLYGSLAQAFTQIEDRVGLPLEQILSIPQGEVCIAIVPKENTFPQLVALMEVGDNMVRVQTLLQRAKEELTSQGVVHSTEVDGDIKIDIFDPPGDNPEALVVFQRAGTIGIATSVASAKSVLAAWKGESQKSDEPFVPLASSRKFTAIMSRCAGSSDEPPQVSWFVDPIELFKAFARTNAGARTALAFLPVIGIDGLEGIGGSIFMTAGEFENVSHMHVLLSSPRAGVIKALAMSSGDTTPEPFVPNDVINYISVNWDVDTTYREVGKLLSSFQGEGALPRLIKSNISDRLEIDFEAQFVQQLTGRVIYASRAEKPARFNSATTLVAVEMKDGKAAQKLLDAVMLKADPFTKSSFAGITYYSTTLNVPQNNADVNPQGGRVQMSLRAPQPTFAVLGDYLVYSDSAKTLESAIMCQSDESRGLAADLEFKLVASRIRRQEGGAEPGMLVFNRPEEGLRIFYDLLVADETQKTLANQAANNRFFQTIDSALKEHPLPPFAVLAKYLAPGGGMMTNDESGFHYMAFNLKRK